MDLKCLCGCGSDRRPECANLLRCVLHAVGWAVYRWKESQFTEHAPLVAEVFRDDGMAQLRAGRSGEDVLGISGGDYVLHANWILKHCMVHVLRIDPYDLIDRMPHRKMWRVNIKLLRFAWFEGAFGDRVFEGPSVASFARVASIEVAALRCRPDAVAAHMHRAQIPPLRCCRMCMTDHGPRALSEWTVPAHARALSADSRNADCPVCLHEIEEGVMCPNRHTTCVLCAPRVHECPLCRARFGARLVTVVERPACQMCAFRRRVRRWSPKLNTYHDHLPTLDVFPWGMQPGREYAGVVKRIERLCASATTCDLVCGQLLDRFRIYGVPSALHTARRLVFFHKELPAAVRSNDNRIFLMVGGLTNVELRESYQMHVWQQMRRWFDLIIDLVAYPGPESLTNVIHCIAELRRAESVSVEMPLCVLL